MNIIEKETKDNQVELEIFFEGGDEDIYNELMKRAEESGITVNQLIEHLIEDYVKDKKYE